VFPKIITTDVMWKEDDKPLAASVAGQPRGDCPYLNNSDFVGAGPRASPRPLLLEVTF